ncbi:putative ribonuclease H-like domain-containing protein [Tanacetum coccineum]
MSVFEVRSSDEEITPANDRFSKADGYHAVPPPITGNFLTLRADISFAGLDEYAIRKKIIESKTDTSKPKTSETIGNTNEVNIEKPKSVHESVVPKPKINKDKVIIEDWNSDDDDDVSAIQIGNLESILQDHAVVDSGCSSHMTGNKAYLSDYKDYNGGFVAFGSDPKGDELNFKLLDENQVVLRAPRHNGVYSLDLKNIVPSRGKPPSISFMRPFGCPLTILNTLDPLDKFDGKSDEGYLLGYSTTRSGPDWMFDIDLLTNTMYYIPICVENQVNMDADLDDATRQAFKEEKKRADQATNINKLNTGRPFVSTSNSPLVSTANTPYASAASTPTGANTVGSSFVYLGGQIPINASTLPNADLHIDPNMPDLEDGSNVFPNDGIFSGAYNDEDVGAEADFNNMDDTIDVSLIPILKVHKDHPKCQILGDPKSAFQTRGKIQKAFLVQQALVRKKAIGTKWVFRNKRDDWSIVVKNKARLVAQGFRHEEGIDYDEVFSPVARIEAIRLFLAFASFMGFPVYQMNIKSAFVFGTIEEEVYVYQPPGFIDPAHPNKVYKVIKALYGLHQALRAWYETLSSFLLKNGFRRVDDIIFGSTTQSMCIEFEDCMHKRFQMSSMGELTYFLGLQVKQKPDEIFIIQDKYVADILKKFNFCSIKPATTPIESNKPLVKDEDGVDMDVHVYRSMIGSLAYLIASRPDIMFAVCVYARFQVTPKASHLNAVKRIFRLVAQGFRHQEGIDYDEVFAPVAKIEAIRLFLAFASFIGFPVYQMNVKSAFLYGTIEEEVYVHQPPGFIDPAHPNKVYKVIKALYGLHQALRACSTTQSMCIEFEDCMHKRFQMSSMGELTFFLGLQVKQKPNEIFIGQDKYVANILKKFNFCSIKPTTTPIESNKPLVKDEDGVDVDVHVYRSMIGSLAYLTASRPDIMFVVYVCARFQVTLKASHLNAVKRIFRDCYKKRLIDVIKIHTNANVIDLLTKGFDVTRFKFLVANLVLPDKFGAARKKFVLFVTVTTVVSMANLEFVDQHNMVACLAKTEGNSNFHKIVDFLASSSIHHTLTIDATIDSKAVVVTEASIRSSLLFNDADAHNLKVFTNMSRKGLKFSGKVTPLFDYMLVPNQAPEGEGSDQPTEPQSTPSPTQPSTGGQPPETSPSHVTTQDSRDSLEGTDGNEGDQVQTPHDSPFLGGHTSDKAEGALNLQELSVLYHVMEYMKTEEAVDEGRQSGDNGGNAKELVSTARPELSTATPNVNAARQEDSAVKPRTPPTKTSIFEDEDITIAQTLIKMKDEKAKEKGVSFKDVKDSSRLARSTLTLKPLLIINPKDKGKSILEELEPKKKMTRSDFDAAQIARDAEIARQLQVDLQAKVERERQREEKASKAAIAEMYDEVQAGIDADALFIAKLQ